MLKNRLQTTLLLAIAPLMAVSWQLGEICNGVNYSSTPAQDMLKGKHLLVFDTKWAPYATPEPEAPKGWVGLDVDLLDHISWLLGFTYEIQDMGYPADGETWTDVALRAQYHSDMLASYWTPQPERRNGATMFRGHLDLSTVLVARREDASIADQRLTSLTSWARPFSAQLWTSFVLLIILSGVIDWYLERDYMPGHKITSSIYEYCAGVLWGGFEQPISRSSAVYQIVLAFILLIINASYTANLAAFITVSQKQALSAESVVKMQAEDNGRLCTADGGYMDRFEASYPMANPSILGGNSEAANALLDAEQCDALIASQITFDGYRTNAEFCSFEVAEVLFVEKGGWMTNRESTCVFNAIEWALGELEANGTVDSLYRTHMPVVQCVGESVELDTFESTGTEVGSRRKLTSRDRARVRRKLKGGAGGGAAAGGAEAGSTTMGMVDFVGVFAFWIVITIGVVTVTTVPKIVAFCKRKFGGPLRVEVQSSRGDGLARDASAFGLKAAVDKTNIANDENAMLREVLRQLGGLHNEIAAVKAGQDATVKGLGASPRPGWAAPQDEVDTLADVQ